MKMAADSRTTVNGSLESIVHVKRFFFKTELRPRRHHTTIKCPFYAFQTSGRTEYDRDARARSLFDGRRCRLAAMSCITLLFGFYWLRLPTIFAFNAPSRQCLFSCLLLFYRAVASSSSTPSIRWPLVLCFYYIHSRAHHAQCKSITVTFILSIDRLYQTLFCCSFRSRLLLLDYYCRTSPRSLSTKPTHEKRAPGKCEMGSTLCTLCVAFLIFSILSFNLWCLHFGPSAIISIFFPFIFSWIFLLRKYCYCHAFVLFACCLFSLYLKTAAIVVALLWIGPVAHAFTLWEKMEKKKMKEREGQRGEKRIHELFIST